MIVLIAAVNVVDQINGVIVAAVVLALEAAVVAAWLAVYRRLPAPRRLGQRRRLAARLGWQFQPQAAVPVPGPATAVRLIGVPTDALSTTGGGLLSATVNGAHCLVYDRARRRPRLGDPVQTVWMVQLPTPLPYVTSGEVMSARPGAGDGEQQPSGSNLARAIAASPAATRAGRGLPHWWIEGGYLCSVQESAVPASVIAPRVEQLTRFAAKLPWSQLQRLAGIRK